MHRTEQRHILGVYAECCSVEGNKGADFVQNLSQSVAPITFLQCYLFDGVARAFNLLRLQDCYRPKHSSAGRRIGHKHKPYRISFTFPRACHCDRQGPGRLVAQRSAKGIRNQRPVSLPEKISEASSAEDTRCFEVENLNGSLIGEYNLSLGIDSERRIGCRYKAGGVGTTEWPTIENNYERGAAAGKKRRKLYRNRDEFIGRSAVHPIAGACQDRRGVVRATELGNAENFA
jgi:hypothetical protein